MRGASRAEAPGRSASIVFTVEKTTGLRENLWMPPRPEIFHGKKQRLTEWVSLQKVRSKK